MSLLILYVAIVATAAGQRMHRSASGLREISHNSSFDVSPT
jgi:hypothetical protein